MTFISVGLIFLYSTKFSEIKTYWTIPYIISHIIRLNIVIFVNIMLISFLISWFYVS